MFRMIHTCLPLKSGEEVKLYDEKYQIKSSWFIYTGKYMHTWKSHQIKSTHDYNWAVVLKSAPTEFLLSSHRMFALENPPSRVNNSYIESCT